MIKGETLLLVGVYNFLFTYMYKVNALLCCTRTSQPHTTHRRVKVEEVGDVDIGLDLQGNTHNNTGEKVCRREKDEGEGGRKEIRKGGREKGGSRTSVMCVAHLRFVDLSGVHESTLCMSPTLNRSPTALSTR